MAVKKKKYQAGGTTTPTLEQRHQPQLEQAMAQAGINEQGAGAAPTALPSGTELTTIPAALGTGELETTTGTTVGAVQPTATQQVPTTGLNVTAPSTPTPGTYSSTNVLNSVAEANAQLGNVSQGAISAPQGTVSQQSLATAAQGTAAQATQVTRTLSPSELFTAASQSDVGGYTTATAQEINTPQEATVQYQLQQLMGQFSNGQIPQWAAPAITQANAIMAQRGLGQSSMAGQAIIHAMMESVVPIAAADAQVHQQFALQNLSNRQQTAIINAQMRAAMQGQELTNEQQARAANAAKISEINNLNFTSEQTIALENAKLMQGINLSNLTNTQQAALQNAATLAGMDTKNLDSRLTSGIENARQFLQMDMKNLDHKQQAAALNAQAKNQGLFTDQAATNAANQFNATSQNQVDQFFAELGAQVQSSNINRVSAQQQFNVDQANSLRKFDAQMEDSRDKFNSEMTQLINQSNVQWRRAINTTNTAEQNRVNQINAQNLLDLTATAQNRLWNRYRDEAEWFVNLVESREARSHQAALTAQQNNFSMSSYNQKAKDAMWMNLGAAVIDGIFNLGNNNTTTTPTTPEG